MRRRPDRARPPPSCGGPARQPPLRSRPSAPELFLDGLTSTEPELPPHAGLGALERRLTDWVDRGLERRSSAPWLLSLRLDERRSTKRPTGRPRRARALAAGCRRSDPRASDLAASQRQRRRLRLPPVGRSEDRRPPPARADRARPRRRRSRVRSRRAHRGSSSRRRRCPVRASRRRSHDSRSSACPCCCRGTGSARRSRLRVNLTATSVAARSSGLLDDRQRWRASTGSSRSATRRSTEEELRELAAAKEPLIRVRGPLARAAAIRGRAGASASSSGAARDRSSTSSGPSRASSSRTPGSSSARSSLDEALAQLLDGATSATSARSARRRR